MVLLTDVSRVTKVSIPVLWKRLFYFLNRSKIKFCGHFSKWCYDLSKIARNCATCKRTCWGGIGQLALSVLVTSTVYFPKRTLYPYIVSALSTTSDSGLKPGSFNNRQARKGYPGSTQSPFYKRPTNGAQLATTCLFSRQNINSASHSPHFSHAELEWIPGRFTISQASVLD